MPKNAPKINGDFKGKDILSLGQFSPDDIQLLFEKTAITKDLATNSTPTQMLAGHVIGLIFYEPSSRTFGSFAAAAKRMGAATIEYTNPKENSSVAKGESLSDTMQTMQSYTEAIVIRHAQAGAAHEAAESADVPVLNAGDGVGEHPTQALLDLYTIYEEYKRLDNLTILFAGDILNGRTVHSLLRGLSLYKNNTIYLLSPKELTLKPDDLDAFREKGLSITEIQDENDIPKDADIWYWTRVQKERFASIEEYEKVKNRFIVTKEFLDKYAGSNTLLMHPLPRVGEITTDVDSDPRAIYLRKQMRNGMYVRMALLGLVLGKI